MADTLNHPAHYTTGTIECADYLKDNMPKEAYLGWLEGSAKKYLHRWRYKDNPLEDLGKAVWFLKRLENDYKEFYNEEPSSSTDRYLKLNAAEMAVVQERAYEFPDFPFGAST